jgi:hypothetical protein
MKERWFITIFSLMIINGKQIGYELLLTPWFRVDDVGYYELDITVFQWF